MRFQDINEIKKISSILKDISFTDFKVKINGTSIYKKSESKFVLVLEPFYEENISKIHRLIWEKLEDDEWVKHEIINNPSDMGIIKGCVDEGTHKVANIYEWYQIFMNDIKYLVKIII